MKLVVAEKPSVAPIFSCGAGRKGEKRWVSGRRRLAGVLVRGSSGGACPAGSLWGAVCQMAVCGSAYPSRPLEI